MKAILSAPPITGTNGDDSGSLFDDFVVGDEEMVLVGISVMEGGAMGGSLVEVDVSIVVATGSGDVPMGV
jgi:hypothetical protein